MTRRDEQRQATRGTERVAIRNRWLGWLVVALLTVGSGGPGAAILRGEEELGRRSSWSPPSVAQVRGELDQWLTSRKVDDPTRQRVAALWARAESLEGPELLDCVVDSIAVVLPAAAELVAAAQQETGPESLLKSPLWADAGLPSVVRDNLRLYVARRLTQQALYDEALEVLGETEPNQVADPASLLFYRSVAYHRLLQKQQCLPVLARLLENEAAVPRRYLTLARLMDADIRPLEPDSLDEIARLMDDVQRRLDLGRAGRKVRDEEDDVIAKLDKMIEKIEEQLQQQQQQQSGQGGGSQSSSPRSDSTPGGVKGPGNVDPRNIGERAGWGDLPPKERQEVLQQIGKDLPAHYRETIEEYFRKLARDGQKK
ncbi:MAG: hypothetical protein U0935_11270 [Pirellulales bacterium]